MARSKNLIFDRQAERAIKLVGDGENLFITGKAGTGKTTLLKEILRRNEVGSKKNIVILAPTGVAAENAGGMTMHHFFQLPLKPYLPEHKVLPNLFKLKPDIIEVINCLDLIIIDEISMVRCDVLDAMDAILRHYRRNKKPFGGIQVVMFGDLFQLSPVVTDDEWEDMKPYYRFAYFFCSHVLMNMKYRLIELDKVYRQDDIYFVKLLNNVRIADVRKEDLAGLDDRYEPDFSPEVDDDVVTLTTHNRKSNSWNERMFSLLGGKTFEYEASRQGFWYGKLPVKYRLELKVGARVMFLRNTDSYKNGTMGRVAYIGKDYIMVRKDDGQITEVKKAVWEQLEYKVDKTNKVIYTEVTATYTQYPLKLAWAVSIHKSQGLTFDEVAIDASRAFAFGQVYVALSRCRTLEGIHLLSIIPYQKIIADDIVKEYHSCIDKDGYVSIPDDFEPVNYEDGTLLLNISRRKFLKLESGEMNTYKHSIDAANKEQLFLHQEGKICINKVFRHLKKNWSIEDTNGGHCPFVQRQYKKVIFTCTDMRKKVEAEIVGYTEIYLNSDNCWAFRFRIRRIGKVVSY